MFQKIEECLNKTIKCSDGCVRRLNEVKPYFLDYEGFVDIDGDKYWYNFGKISRNVLEKYLLQGKEVSI